MNQQRDTIILSDVHLTEFEEGNGLWKRYHQRRYAPDSHIIALIDRLTAQYPDRAFEFVFNGDTFDFDVVHLLPKNKIDELVAKLISRKYRTTEENAVAKTEIILKEHAQLFDRLQQATADGHNVVFLRGNHDVELTWPAVQEAIRSRIVGDNEVAGQVDRQCAETVQFHDWFYYKKDAFYIEHGNQYDPYTMNPNNLHPYTDHDQQVELSYGSLGTRVIGTRIGFFNPYLLDQFVMTGWGYIQHFRKYKNPKGNGFLKTWIVGGIQTMRTIFRIPHIVRIVQRKNHLEKRAQLAKQNTLPDEALATLEAMQPEPVMRKWRQMFALIKLDMILVVTGLTIALIALLATELFFDIPSFQKVLFAFLFIDALIIGYFMLYNKKPASANYKEIATTITHTLNVPTVIMGHTHEAGRIDLAAGVKYLNTGTWAPAYYDVECTRPLEYLHSFVWVHNGDSALYEWTDNEWIEVMQEPRYLADAAKKEKGTPWIRNQA